MARLKFTKQELKSQRDSLSRFTRFLPTLQLKKQQLQAELRRVATTLRDKRQQLREIETRIAPWIALYAEPYSLQEYMGVQSLDVRQGNVVGVSVDILESVIFDARMPALSASPAWVDEGLGVAREMATLQLEIHFLHAQRQALAEELRITAQRVNLFEKVKIPESKENIRRIKIALGDLETAAVARAKMAKGRQKEARRGTS